MTIMNSTTSIDNLTNGQNISGNTTSNMIMTPTDAPPAYAEMKETVYFVLGVLSLSIIPLLFGGNFLVLLSLYLYQRLRTAKNFFIGSLALFDLLLSVMALPVYTIDFWYHELLLRHNYLCLFKYTSVLFSLSGSLFSLLAIAVDRYIAILDPLKYRTRMTKGRAKKILAALWVYSIAIAIIPYFWNQKEEFNSKCDFFVVLPPVFTIITTFIAIFIILVVATGLYIRIFLVATRQKQKMLKMKTRFNPSRRKQFQNDSKSASTMALILFLFILFWTPFLVAGPLKYLDIDENITDITKSIAVLIAQMNSAINPFIYGFMKTEFSEAFKKIFYRCIRRKGPPVQAYNNSESSKSTEVNSVVNTPTPEKNPDNEFQKWTENTLESMHM